MKWFEFLDSRSEGIWPCFFLCVGFSSIAKCGTREAIQNDPEIPTQKITKRQNFPQDDVVFVVFLGLKTAVNWETKNNPNRNDQHTPALNSTEKRVATSFWVNKKVPAEWLDDYANRKGTQSPIGKGPLKWSDSPQWLSRKVSQTICLGTKAILFGGIANIIDTFRQSCIYQDCFTYETVHQIFFLQNCPPNLH